MTEQGGKYEASMNFDLESVRPFLLQLEKSLGLGLNVEKLVKLVETTEVENLHGSSFDVTYKGENISVLFSAFMDDIDAPDIHFFVASAELAEAIDQEVERFCEALGI